jgi:uncharacterized protein (DUF2336 family)
MSSLVSRLFGSRKPRRGKRGPKYETAKQKAREKDPEARRKVAARTNVEPEILYYLAEDVDRRVRREIARNKAPPPHADVLLARDTDDEVRTDLARKIGRLAPRLSKREAGHLEQLTLEALEILARDTLPQVRAIIAEEIKRLDNIPKPLIDALARDVELIVAAPILEYSPLLNDDDLLEIISSKPVQGALSAIARREGLSESISDSIAAVFDVDAIARLLANPSAQIREETLDHLIDRAPDQGDWHEPLVLRPHLSKRAILRLARFVTSSLITMLKERHDVDPDTLDKIADRAERRLDRESPAPDGAAPGSVEAAAAESVKAEAAESVKAEAAESGEAPNVARDLHKAGKLDEEVILARVEGEDREFVVQALACLTDMAPVNVKRVFQSKSAQGVTALTWGAGLSMRAATILQTKLAGIEQDAILRPTDDGGFPLDEDELTWRLELYT